ncbi:MAG TPA: T9SS type A sorting domain-containing protein, partial [Vicingus sp.]|nr:T9SS type A sorting domain-containing protein [Vicingus sp.]
NIYPNPTNNYITIELNQNFDLSNSRIMIVNSLGEVLVNQQATDYTNKINLSNFAQGVYYVRITSNENNYTQLIVKQ